jgi:hypothetical protein
MPLKGLRQEDIVGKLFGGCLKVVGGVVVALVVIAIAIGALGSGDDSGSAPSASGQAQVEASADASSEAEAASEPIVFEDVDINTLFETLSNNPLNAKNTYEGATIRFTGYLSNIDASGKYFNVKNGDEWSFESIQCYINDEATLDRIASSAMGDELTICGTVTSVGEVLGYSLDVDHIE